MGERWHLVRGYGFDALCGVPWRSSDRMTMERRVVSCPRCLTVSRSARPTVQVMEGGETGEDDCGDQPWITLVAYFGNGQIEPLTCPAPTPRAP
jgi:hypothetical protein